VARIDAVRRTADRAPPAHRQVGNKDGLQASYGHQALILKDWGRPEEALALLKKQEALCLQLGNRSSLAYCYANWGLLAREQRDRNTEREKLAAALVIFRDLKMPGERDKVRAELDKLGVTFRTNGITFAELLGISHLRKRSSA
jgi:hypothetical protein